MGRIAPRKRKTTWTYHALLRLCQRLIRRGPERSEEGEQEHVRSRATLSGKRVKTCLSKIWHLPDNYHWMEPLPLFHRRWLLIAIGLLLVVLLWPYSPPQSPTPRPVTVPIEQVDSSVPMQAEIIEPPMQTEITPTPPPQQQRTEANWHRYQIASGQTLAQLFRDNNLPVGDVFAMAQVEGRDKPLSNLRAGQDVKLQLNAQGMVTELEITTTDNQTVRFTRNADGAFTRTP
ncbi:OapA family protein [Pectobacterium sp. B1J-3]|uniref:OapA family protein n=1 Tax=Pectobacterium sp. B1J-3 TaxID=3385371 RepID=UPI003905DCD2